MEFIEALINQSFLQIALIAVLLASLCCGVMGSYVVVKRITFLAGGIAHSVLGGMGAAVYFEFDPYLAAMVTAILAAMLIGVIRIRWQTHEDTLIGALWAVGMSIGILFLSKSPGYQPNLIGYLFGNLLLVSPDYLWFMAQISIAIIAIVLIWHRQFLAVVLDEEFASLRGVPVTFFYLLLLALIALTVVVLIQVVGLILVLALLTLPSAISSYFVNSIIKMMIFATIIGALMSFIGIGLSYNLDLPAGATIVVVSASCYIFALLIKFNHFLKFNKCPREKIDDESSKIKAKIKASKPTLQ